MIHLPGFGGSALIILSITMRSVVRLRVIGLAGAATFVVYGLALAAWPVVVTNLVASSIHVFHLRRLVNSRAVQKREGDFRLESSLGEGASPA